MRSRLQMEARVISEVERIGSQARGHEDSFVELKSILPDDHRRAARQLAAICNAARGEEVLWIVGIAEDSGEVIELPSTDLQDWWPRVAKCFDEVAPEMLHIVVPVDDGKVVIGMFFASERAPYVVTTDGQSKVEREVPWREGGRTRSARRQDLIRMLSPAVGLPQVELIDATLMAIRRVDVVRPDGTLRDFSRVSWNIQAEFFVDADMPVTFPSHRQRVSVKVADSGWVAGLNTVVSPESTGAVIYEGHAVRVEHPARVYMHFAASERSGSAEKDDRLARQIWSNDNIPFELMLAISGNDRRIVFSEFLARDGDPAEPPVKPDQKWTIGAWSYRADRLAR